MEIIKLNLIPSGVNPICHAKQYDEGRIIRFMLFDGLTPYTLQSGDTVTLNLRKPDNTIIESSVTATQGNKYVDLVTTEQICAVAGFNLGTFKITNGSVEIGTLNFIMEVGKDVLANGIPSQSVIEDLDALVAEAVEQDLGDNYYNKTEIDNKLLDKADKADLDAIKENISSKNIFDSSYLASLNGWTVNNGVYYGAANGLTYYNSRNYPITFEENTQYTISLEAKTDGNETTSGNGAKIWVKYSDNSQDDIDIPNSYTSFTDVTFTTDAGKTVSELHFTRITSGSNIWYFKNFQIEKGTSKTSYVPYINAPTAIDLVARNQNDNTESQLNQHETAVNPHGINKQMLGIDLATTTASGLMSPTDKQKLDSIVGGGTITISGSGVTKNASAYGFLPTNDATTNSIALQNALNGGGTVLVDYAGVYEVCKTIYLDSDTTLIFGANVFLKRVKDSNNVTARYPFVNRGAFTGDTNENISIIGLHLIVNGNGAGTDIQDTLIGLRGQLAFLHVKKLSIIDFEIADGNVQYYNIHIQDFDNIYLENIKITSQKDGIHLGGGKNFTIKNCYFKTNDDAIAMNAHDYPTGTMDLGWIENGIIENIHFLSAPDFNTGRGLYMLGGSWSEWASGNSYRTYGDACVSNGRIYRTTGQIVASPFSFITSTDQPTHLSGSQTYSDGLTWTMVQDYNVGYNAGVRNVTMRNIYFSRATTAALTMNMDNDQFSRGYYPNSDAPIFENINLENVIIDDNCVLSIADMYVPFRNLKFNNVLYNTTSKFARLLKEEIASYPCDMLLTGTYFKFSDTNSNLIWDRYGAPLDIKIANSMGNLSHTKTISGTGINIISEDIGLS